MTDKTYSINGIKLLQLMFIYLKLTGDITWSWWWVLSPIWIAILLVLILLVVVGSTLKSALKRK